MSEFDSYWSKALKYSLQKDPNINHVVIDNDLNGLFFHYNDIIVFITFLNKRNIYSLSFYPYKNLSGGNLSFSSEFKVYKITSILNILIILAESRNIDPPIISDEKRIDNMIGFCTYKKIRLYREYNDLIINIFGLNIRLYLVGNDYGLRIMFDAINSTGLGIISKSYIALIKCLVALTKICKTI
jgi:hypothetical protein